MSKTSSPPSTCFISRVSNEVLQLIFSFIPNAQGFDSYNSYHSHSEGNHNVAQELILRSVCRHFRAIVNESHFWLARNFKFASLLKRRLNNREEGEFTRTLLKDRHLVKCLQRKTAWNFSNLNSLFAVIKNIPSFPQCARNIALAIVDHEDYRRSDGPSAVTTAIEKLAICQHVTSLSIRWTMSVDLDAVVRSFPLLENIKLEEIIDCHGSLRRLTNVKKLTIDNRSISEDPSTFLSLVIPAESTKSLTSLNVVTSATKDPAIIPKILLNQFVNLTHLCIQPLGNEMCDSVTSASFQLQDFETEFAKKFISKFKYLDIFAAQSLRHLKKLSLETYGLSKEHCRQIVVVITSNLHSLQHLEVNMGLDCSLCRLFTSMVHLRYLKWRCSYSLFDSNDGPLPGGDPFQKQTCRSDKVKRGFELAFADFAQKPRLDIYIYKM
jgi:hypothetical protein